MSELGESNMPKLRETIAKLEEATERMLGEPLPEQSSEPVKIETEDIFDAELLNQPDPDSFTDDPVKIWKGTVDDLKDMILHRGPFAMPPAPELEHKVRIFRLNDRTVPADVCAEIEALLNDGYCCHMPTVCNDFLVMDFSRRKDSEEAPATRATNQ